MTKPPREEGSAFIIALLVMFALTVLGLSLSLVTQVEIMMGGQERILERTFYAAESGLELSIARALASGDFRGVTYERARSEIEQGLLMNVRERVRSSPFFCLGDAPCNLCSINQGSEFVRRNHVVAVDASRFGVAGDGTETPVGRKSLSRMVDVEPMRTIVDCLAGLPESASGFRFQ